MEIEISGSKYELKSLRYLDVIELSGITNRVEHALKLLELSGIPKEVANNLTPKQGAEVMSQINELNGFLDFQSPAKNE